MQPKLLLIALAGSAVAMPAFGKRADAAGASLENVETAAWYSWFKRAIGFMDKREKDAGASLENVETAAWYGWI